MSHVIWSEEALSDVVRLHAFLSQHSEYAADRAVAKIREEVRLLSKDVLSGRGLGDRGAKRREWIIRFGRGAYVLAYDVTDRAVLVSSIRHSREEIAQPFQ